MNVLSDFQEEFRRLAEPYGDGEMLWTKKIYQIDRWDPAQHQILLQRFNFYVDLVNDLMLELTRAGNMLCDRVRDTFLPTYRLREGRLVIQTGPNIRFQYDNVVVQYNDAVKKLAQPYPGLESFLTVRAERDMHFGSTTAPSEKDA